MIWNLADAMDTGNGPRMFYPPLATNPEGFVATTEAEKEQYSIALGTTLEGFTCMEISIDALSSSSFDDDGELPNTCIRLTAMAAGQLFFLPADSLGGDRLVLQMPMFGLLESEIRAKAPWWQQWVDAECIPFQLIYENVDRSYLESLMTSDFTVGVDFYGLSYPYSASETSDPEEFVRQFFLGKAAVMAEAGACIGKAAEHPSDSSKKFVSLHGRYTEHQLSRTSWPMHPREFIYLLFGNEADEIEENPFFLAMEASTHPSGENESLSFKFRPPLRTHERLMWEADQEESGHRADWKKAGSLTSARYVDRLTQDDERGAHRSFDYGKTFSAGNKCSTYLVDICLRSGFRVPIMKSVRDGVSRWQGADTGSIVMAVKNIPAANTGTLREVVKGDGIDFSENWAWRIDNLLNSIILANAASSQMVLLGALNKLMAEEGRCLVVVYRKNRIEDGDLYTVGHSMLVDRFVDWITSDSHGIVNTSFIELSPTAGNGLKSFRLYTRMAGTQNGATAINHFQDGGDTDTETLKKFIYLFELHPGGDPGTTEGFEDLNVQIKNRDLM